MTARQRVLIIDDVPDVHESVRLQLREEDVKVLSALSGAEGLAIARQEKPDLVLVDVQMPGLTGFEVCRHLKLDPATSRTPVILISGTQDDGQKLRAFDVGAADFFTKPFVEAEFQARIRAALRTQALVVELDRRARLDELTGLTNREAFLRELQQCLAFASARDGYQLAVLLLDIDRFKLINDSLGHDAGDEALRIVADRLRANLRGKRHEAAEGPGDCVARLGGDEFAILLTNLPNRDTALRIACRLKDILSDPHLLRQAEVIAGVSIGVRFSEGRNDTAHDLLRDSDIAVHRAKAQGRDQIVVFESSMHQEVISRLTLERDLARAVAREELHLVYQPIIAAESGDVSGFEALVRWRHPTRGLISPNQFIPIAEETGIISELGDWVLRTAGRQLAAWRERFPNARRMYVSVNLSRKQLYLSDLRQAVGEAVRSAGISPSAIQLELTENVIMHDLEHVKRLLTGLREDGVRLAMDDFGTGYSSLAALHELPMDMLKIDRGFIGTTPISRSHAAIVRSVIELAHNLGMCVVAEGVETDDQLALLQALNCDYVQGFYFARPMPLEEMEQLLARQPCSFVHRPGPHAIPREKLIRV